MPFLFILFVLVVCFIFFWRTVKIVPQKQVKVVERLGKFHKLAEAGLNVIVPFVDSVRATHDLRERITQIEPQQVITRDNVTMEVDAVIYFLIADPVRATYEVAALDRGLNQLTLSALRNTIGALDLDHTLTSRDSINTQLRVALDAATQQWGVKVVRVELKNITPPEEIRITMEKQMTAERTRRAVVTQAEGAKAAAILTAEGEKQSRVVSAEGLKQSAILAAEGEATARMQVANAEAAAIQVIAQAVGQSANPTQYLIAKSYLESLTQIARGANKTVFLPFEATGALAALGGMKDIFAGVGTDAPRAAGNVARTIRPPQP